MRRKGGLSGSWARALGPAALGLALGCAAQPARPEVPASGARPRFDCVVLGVAQDGGLPHLGCQRACCAEARREGRALRQACLGIHDRRTGKLVLVEATPAIESQVAELQALAGAPRAGSERSQASPVDAILLTHAHIGHYAGLIHLGREVAATKSIPVHASPRMATFLETNGPWSQLVALGQIRLERFEPGKPFEPIAGLRVTAIPVPHREEFSDTQAFKIRGSERTILFVPDVDAWDRQPGLLDLLLDGVDLAFVDGTFYDGSELPHRDPKEIPHPLMLDTMRRLAGTAAERAGVLRFIHMNHTNPVLRSATLRRDLEARGFRVAHEGEVLGF